MINISNKILVFAISAATTTYTFNTMANSSSNTMLPKPQPSIFRSFFQRLDIAKQIDNSLQLRIRDLEKKLEVQEKLNQNLKAKASENIDQLAKKLEAQEKLNQSLEAKVSENIDQLAKKDAQIKSLKHEVLSQSSRQNFRSFDLALLNQLRGPHHQCAPHQRDFLERYFNMSYQAHVMKIRLAQEYSRQPAGAILFTSLMDERNLLQELHFVAQKSCRFGIISNPMRSPSNSTPSNSNQMGN